MRSDQELLLGVTAFVMPICFHIYYHSNREITPQTAKKLTRRVSFDEVAPATNLFVSPKITIIYASTTGTAKSFATKLLSSIQSVFSASQVNLIDAIDYDEEQLESGGLLLLLCSTSTDGKPPLSGLRLHSWLKDMVNDFRVNKTHLQKLSFSVFGLGGRIYGDNFGLAVRALFAY